MSTYYNEKEKEACDFIVSMGKSVDALQLQLELERQSLKSCQRKIKQYESMTGVLSQKMPEPYVMPLWDYMLKHTSYEERK